MIAPEVLQGFDLLLWLDNGRLAAAQNGCSQPTISRQAHEVATKLQLSLQKVRGAWDVQGDTTLLRFERQLHQMHRMLGRAPLRLEVGAVSGRLLGLPAPPGWVTGPADPLNQPRSLRLLMDRVIDAWLTPSGDDLPQESDPSWRRFDLYRAPVSLVAAADHPLTDQPQLRSADLRGFPSAGLPTGWFPNSEAHLRGHGLWSQPVWLPRYEQARWDGRTADGRTLAYASPPMLTLNPALRRLDYDLDLEHRTALVVHRDHAESGPIMRLLRELQQRCRGLAPRHPELMLCTP